MLDKGGGGGAQRGGGRGGEEGVINVFGALGHSTAEASSGDKVNEDEEEEEKDDKGFFSFPWFEMPVESIIPHCSPSSTTSDCGSGSESLKGGGRARIVCCAAGLPARGFPEGCCK